MDKNINVLYVGFLLSNVYGNIEDFVEGLISNGRPYNDTTLRITTSRLIKLNNSTIGENVSVFVKFYSSTNIVVYGPNGTDVLATYNGSSWSYS